MRQISPLGKNFDESTRGLLLTTKEANIEFTTSTFERLFLFLRLRMEQ
jgi:hypothetical protein